MKDGEKEMKVQGGDEVVVRRKNEVNEREKETLIMERENPPKVENNTSHGGKKILPWKGFAAARFFFLVNGYCSFFLLLGHLGHKSFTQ